MPPRSPTSIPRRNDGRGRPQRPGTDALAAESPNEQRKAAGGVLTAKQAPRRPGTAPAPGLRARVGRRHSTADRPQVGVSTVGYLSSQRHSSFARARGALKPWCGVALWCSLFAVLLLAHLLFRFRAEESPEPGGGQLPAFVEQLQQRGVRLRVVWGARHNGPFEYVFLTEDPGATW